MNRKVNMFLIVFLAICLIASPNLSFADGTKGIEISNFEPYGLLPREMTIHVTYASHEVVPKYYNYREYDNVNEGWWAGLLPLRNIEVLSGGRSRATFEGTIIFSY